VDPWALSYLSFTAIIVAALVILGGAEILLVAGVAWLLRRFAVGMTLRAAAVALAFSLAALALAAPIHLTLGIWIRHDPPGFGGLQRQDQTYLFVAGASFVALLALTLLSAPLAAFLRTRHSGATLASLVGSALLVVLAFPILEFSNACYIGRPFLLQPSC
jgi:hypothetical protein